MRSALLTMPLLKTASASGWVNALAGFAGSTYNADGGGPADGVNSNVVYNSTTGVFSTVGPIPNTRSGAQQSYGSFCIITDFEAWLAAMRSRVVDPTRARFRVQGYVETTETGTPFSFYGLDGYPVGMTTSFTPNGSGYDIITTNSASGTNISSGRGSVPGSPPAPSKAAFYMYPYFDSSYSKTHQFSLVLEIFADAQ